MINRFFRGIFTQECFTFIYFARWENESSFDGFFVTLWQFMTLEISSLTHGKMRCHGSRRNCPRMCNKPIFLERSFILLFSSDRIHEANIFSSVEETCHRAQELCRIVKQRRLLILLLPTMKQQGLLMLFLTTPFSFKTSQQHFGSA